MKTLFKSERGVVSIFLMIIILVVFIFNAILIDYARIFIAEKQTERAVKTGVRSAMSAFDKTLLPYGLYGLKEDPNQIFEDVVKKNLAVEDAEFQFIDTKLEKSSVEESGDAYTLANLDVYEEQVLQNMKYIAPIEYTKIILDKFNIGDLQQDVAGASAFVDVMSKVEPLYNEREEALDEFETLLGQIKNSVEKKEMAEKITTSRNNVPPNEQNWKALGVVKVLEDMIAQLDILALVIGEIGIKKLELKQKEEVPEDETEEEKKEREEEIEELEQQITDLEKLVDNYKKNSIKLAGEVEKHFQNLANNQLAKAIAQLNTAIEKNNEIKSLVDQAATDNGATTDDINLADMYYEPSIMSKWKDLLTQASDDVDQLALNATSIKNVFTGELNWENAATLVAKLGAGLVGIHDIKDSYQKAKESVLALHSDFTENRQRLSEEEMAEKEEHEKIAEEETEAAKKQQEKAAEMVADLVEQDAIYKAVHDKFLGYSSVNESIEEAKAAEMNLEDYNKVADSAMGIMDSIMGALSKGLYSFRDEIYFNEYILRNFTSGEPYSITNKESYYFAKKEVEYIIYGFPTAYANYAAAYSQLFAMRFAFHLVSQLMDPMNKRLGHPALIFIAVVALAIVGAVEDMERMIERGGTANFFPPFVAQKLGKLGAQFRVSYRDHIRFFLLTNGKHENKMMRTQAVTDFKTGVDLSTRPVQAVGEATSSVSLWFLPGALDFLGKTGVLDGQVIDKDRFEFTKKGAFSY